MFMKKGREYRPSYAQNANTSAIYAHRTIITRDILIISGRILLMVIVLLTFTKKQGQDLIFPVPENPLVFWYEIQGAGTIEEGTVPVPLMPYLRREMTTQHLSGFILPGEPQQRG
jgi:hypothetical protein